MKSKMSFCLNIFFLSLLFYPLTNYSKNPNQKIYEIQKISEIFYFTYNCLAITIIAFSFGFFYKILDWYSQNDLNLINENGYVDVSNNNNFNNFSNFQNLIYYKNRIYLFYINFIHLALSFNLFCSFLFFILYFIDPSLVKTPVSLKKNCESYLFTELCLHLFPLLFTLYESTSVCFNRTVYNRSFIYLYGFLYFNLIYFFKLIKNQKFPYKILNDIGTFKTGLVILVLSFALDLSHFMFYRLNKIFHKHTKTEQMFLTFIVEENV